MKLVQINVTLKSGSTGRLAYQLHEHLDANGIYNTIAFGYGNKTEPGHFSIHSKLGSHLHSFMSRKLCMQGLCSVWQTGRLIRYLKREKPDIVHLHNIHGHYLNYVMLFRYLKKMDKPVVWTLHDCWAFTGKCAHYFTAGCEKWKTGCYNCPNLATYPDSTFDGSRRNYNLKKKWFSGLDNLTVVCNSDWVKSQAEQSFLKNKCITRIYNGVDTQVFRPCGDREQVREKYGIDWEKFMILGVSGVWKQEKGMHTFLELSQKFPEDCVLVMVGLSQSQIHQLPDGIVGIEKTESAEALAELYSVADVLLNPSREETFGMVAAEAMACGTPVIVSNTTACPEIVADGTGLVVDMTQISQVVKAITQVKQLTKAHFFEKCTENIRNNFSVNSMCRQYSSLYSTLTADTIEENYE